MHLPVFGNHGFARVPFIDTGGGGLFITDNVLWSGRVLPGQDDRSANTAGVKEFTRRLFAHPGFQTFVNPTRDGVAVALRM